jgi:hypothetical protein
MPFPFRQDAPRTGAVRCARTAKRRPEAAIGANRRARIPGILLVQQNMPIYVGIVNYDFKNDETPGLSTADRRCARLDRTRGSGYRPGYEVCGAAIF